MSDASGTTTYGYDPPSDRLVVKTSPEGEVDWQYDVAGNLTRLSGPTNLGVNYGYDALNRLTSASTSFLPTISYTYDAVGNLAGQQANSALSASVISTSYTYDALNRLTNMQSLCSTGTPACATGTLLSNYAYTLGPAGNRLSVTELSGRTVNYGYDDLYRLTSETILCGTGSCAPGNISYTFDNVGNRLQRNSTVPAIPATGLLNYDNNDRTSTDPYDANGNLLVSGAGNNVYDFENRLVQAGGVTIVYDGDGNRVQETVAGVTTKYQVAEMNPTGYAQVVSELNASGQMLRGYLWGTQLIGQRDFTDGTFTGRIRVYGMDGHGSVRYLTDANGAITDTYDYDAFGNLISSTGSTPNNYLFAGEQFDPALGVYYNRARYYDQRQGRFWTMDTWEGDPGSPESLHKYLYASVNPINRIDPSGNESVAELSETQAVGQSIESKTESQNIRFWQRAFANKTWDVYLGVYPTASFPFVHSFIYTNKRGVDDGVTWDIGIFEGPFEFLRTFFDPNGFLLPTPTTLGAVRRLTTMKSGFLFKFASFNDKQEAVWTFMVIPIGATAKIGETIQVPFSIIPIPGLNSCLKWTFEAAVAALAVQFLPL